MTGNGEMLKDLARMEELIAHIEATADPNMRSTCVELVQLMMELHGSGIARMLELAAEAGDCGANLVTQYSEDELVGKLLMLYELHPVDLQIRVSQALDAVRPLLESHGGNVELLGLEEGVVRLKLTGSCDGCPSSSLTLKNAIEEALNEFAADINGLEVLGVENSPPPLGFVPVEMVTLQ